MSIVVSVVIEKIYMYSKQNRQQVYPTAESYTSVCQHMDLIIQIDVHTWWKYVLGINAFTYILNGTLLFVLEEESQK